MYVLLQCLPTRIWAWALTVSLGRPPVRCGLEKAQLDDTDAIYRKKHAGLPQSSSQVSSQSDHVNRLVAALEEHFPALGHLQSLTPKEV